MLLDFEKTSEKSHLFWLEQDEVLEDEQVILNDPGSKKPEREIDRERRKSKTKRKAKSGYYIWL
jgi:hypothetical protein